MKKLRSVLLALLVLVSLAAPAAAEELAVDAVFLLRPSMAPTDLFPEVETQGSYVKVDRSMATNLPGLFAAGDCTGGPLQVAKATGEGLIAGQKAAAYVDALTRKKG